MKYLQNNRDPTSWEISKWWTKNKHACYWLKKKATDQSSKQKTKNNVRRKRQKLYLQDTHNLLSNNWTKQIENVSGVQQNIKEWYKISY